MTDFPDISRKSEGLGLELVSRNLTLSLQQKPVPGPPSLQAILVLHSEVSRS